MITLKIPARICFFGDHQDYLGLPVIAGTINRFIYLNAQPNHQKKYCIELPDINQSRTIVLEDGKVTVTSNDYFLSGLEVLRKKGLKFEQGYDITITGNIPINAGLSSSSALVVAWICFLIEAQETSYKFSNIEVGHLAFTSEVMFFNQPGGIMDQYTIAQGGLLYIDTNTAVCHSLKGNLGTMVVAESGIAKQTLEVLKKARIYTQEAIAAIQQKHPTFRIQSATLEDYERYKTDIPKAYFPYWYAAIQNYDLTLKARATLQTNGAYEVLGKWMNSHQHILENFIQNTPKSMINMMKTARKSGAIGTKIIGSGGGGCMVALVNEKSKEQVIEAFLAAGAKAAYEVKLHTND